MTLKNLLGISLDAMPADKEHAAKLLAAAQRNIADAQLAGLSAENRFDAACKAIMQMAMVVVNANGLTSKPGHQETTIQTVQLNTLRSGSGPTPSPRLPCGPATRTCRPHS